MSSVSKLLKSLLIGVAAQGIGKLCLVRGCNFRQLVGLDSLFGGGVLGFLHSFGGGSGVGDGFGSGRLFSSDLRFRLPGGIRGGNRQSTKNKENTNRDE
jgi:hypothetical protein